MKKLDSVGIVKATYDPEADIRCVPLYQDEEGIFHVITKDTLDKLYQTQVESLESEITTLKQKLKDNQSSLIAVLADNEDLTKQLRIESEACELLNEQVKELVQKNKELTRKLRDND